MSNENKNNNNPTFEISSKIGNTDNSSNFIKHSKEGSTDGTNTLQDMLNIELQNNNE